VLLLSSCAAGPLVQADESPTQLEEVTVYAAPAGGAALGGSAITQADIQRFERETVDAALLLASGTAVSTVGARNETDIWLRGFDRWRVPFYQDGIPIYLPYDNRIDFGRFSTVDLAQVQVSKGFASVIDGPGAMGGSVNLVSRVAQKPLELEARYGAIVDSGVAYQGSIADVFAGTRQEEYFAQASGSFSNQDAFRLSDDFTAGTLQGPGQRINSEQRDYKVSRPATSRARATNTLSISSTRSATRAIRRRTGSSPSPPSTRCATGRGLRGISAASTSLSQSALDSSGSYVKTRVYYDRFYNVLDSYDTLSYSTQNSPKSFVSTYDDRAAGASVELAEVLWGGADTIRLAGHFRWDQHNETALARNAHGAPQYQQPWETAEESTASISLENIYRPAQAWQLISGVSFDYRDMITDSEWVSAGTTPPYGRSYAYPVADKHALNRELAAIYSYSVSGRVHLSYADRTRFPTLFEMYSTRFSTFLNNPDLQPERSHYGQVGVEDALAGTRVTVNLFLARIDNAITSVALTPTLSQSQNIGAERQEGYEIELRRALLPQLDAGVSWSALTRIELAGSTTPPTDTPSHRLFAFLDFRPVSQLTLTPSVDMEGSRWLQNAVNATLDYHTGSYAVAAFKASYEPAAGISLDIGASNLLDRNYLLEDGYHAPGRQYFANVRWQL
jgi:iron complex outermembrane receptor protein